MQNPEDGLLLLVDKPLGWTSFDVVKKLRNILKVKKIGHAGTLDPLATGLLLIGVGKFTKKLNELQGLDKDYTGIFELGKTTPSYDLETEFDSESGYDGVSAADVEQVKRKFEGAIEQYPPAHSAVKIGGKRAYTLARKNEHVELKKRNVMIHSLDLRSENLPEIEFKVSCSKGTYIRSLAHDIGQELGTGAYLKQLVRTRIGDYSLEEAQTVDEIMESYKSDVS